MNHTTQKDAWQGQANCSLCAIRNSVLFAGLTEQDFEKLHKPIDQFELKAGSKIYSAGEPAEFMYTIRSGLVKLVQYLPDGTQRIVRLLRTADVVGLEATLDPVYKHDAIVLQKAEVCRYPDSAAEALSQSNPKLHLELMKRWQSALDEADSWVTEFSTGSSKQRVARLLIMLAKGSVANTCALFSREDMGAMLGITTETASRMIAEFKRQHLIVKVTPSEYQCDISKLEEISYS
ncbi:MAG TPA: Crp/Fnr family transcriptional regulator [Leucothrix sp.]|nr:Crp/Fnr family transcriptional regulator [Leucothrix sp.]